MQKDNIPGLENTSGNKPKPFFTKSRILFIIVVFVVFLMPLYYRFLGFLLK